MKAQGAATVSKAPRCPPGWDAKAEAKDGPKYRAEFLARQVRGRDDVSDASPLFEKTWWDLTCLYFFAPKMEYVAYAALEKSVQSTNG